MNIVIIIAAVLISLAIGVPIGMVYRKKVAESKIQGAEKEAKRILEQAKIEAENLKKEEIFKAKEEIKERRGEVQKQESRLIQKEENLEKRETNFEKKEKDLEREMQSVEKQKEEIVQLHSQEMEELQKIATLTKEEAKAKLLAEMDKELTAEKAALIREMLKKF